MPGYILGLCTLSARLPLVMGLDENASKSEMSIRQMDTHTALNPPRRIANATNNPPHTEEPRQTLAPVYVPIINPNIPRQRNLNHRSAVHVRPPQRPEKPFCRPLVWSVSELYSLPF